VAVWVKPHAIIPAFAVWLVSVLLLLPRETRRGIVTDFAGLLAGGLLAGAPGVIWLVATGAWPYFLDIFLNWNPAYLSDQAPLSDRFRMVFVIFGAWGVIHFAAIPFALRSLWDAREWSRDPGNAALAPAGFLYAPAANERAAFARALLAALYLGWLSQVVFVQKPFEYAHVPLTLLAMAVVAGQRWCFGFAYLAWFAAIGLLANFTGAPVKFEQHPLANRETLKLWPRCWGEGSSPEMRDRLGRFTHTSWGTNWRELNEVAAYLRTVEPPLGPGELHCWNDTTHPLYLMLDLDPATRYMHYGTALGIQSKRGAIEQEVRASKQRYVVTDLLGTPTSPNDAQHFPWNQPVVFRAGRYVVHRIDASKPLGAITDP
jgi:hypothetical protein